MEANSTGGQGSRRAVEPGGGGQVISSPRQNITSFKSIVPWHSLSVRSYCPGTIYFHFCEIVEQVGR